MALGKKYSNGIKFYKRITFELTVAHWNDDEKQIVITRAVSGWGPEEEEA